LVKAVLVVAALVLVKGMFDGRAKDARCDAMREVSSVTNAEWVHDEAAACDGADAEAFRDGMANKPGRN